MISVEIVARVLVEHFSYRDTTRLLAEMYNIRDEVPRVVTLPSTAQITRNVSNEAGQAFWAQLTLTYPKEAK